MEKTYNMRNTYRARFLKAPKNTPRFPARPKPTAVSRPHVACSCRTSRRLLQADRAARRREAGHDRDRRGGGDLRFAAQGREQQADHPLLRRRLWADLHQLAADHGLLGRQW